MFQPKAFCTCIAVVVLLACLPAIDATTITVQQGGAVTTLGQALGMVGPGDTINVEAGPSAYVEGALLITTPNLTIQGTSGRPRWNGTRLVLGAAGITLRNLEIDGQHTSAMKNLVRVNATASNTLIESCVIVNPASGTGSGLIGSRTSQSNDPEWNDPGTCVTLSDVSNATIRNCNFENNEGTVVYPAGGTYHEVNIVSEAFSPQQNILIEGCAFQAHVRNLQISGEHRNVTIRDNDFNRTQTGTHTIDTPQLNGFSTAAIVFMPPSSGLFSLVCDGLVIDGNRINRAATGIMLFNGFLNNVRIVNNVFSSQVEGPNVEFKCQGDTCVLTGNVFNCKPTNQTGGLSGSFVIETDVPVSTAAGEAFQYMVFRDNHFAGANQDYIYVRASITRMLVEDNVFESCLGSVYFQASNLANVRFVNNTSNGSSSNSDPDAAVSIASANNVVAGNLFRNGDTAVEFHRIPGLVEDPRPGGGNLVASNIITDMALYGIRELDRTISGTAVGRHNRNPYVAAGLSENQYFNNTIAVNQTAIGIDIHTDNVNVYNNILFVNDAGIRITGATQLGTLDFNMVTANGGAGGARNYQGQAAAGAHSLANVNPSFVDFLGRDFNLTPGSAARRAGTAPLGALKDPDYTTNLGAIQDFVVDTGVIKSQWGLYR